MNLVEKRSTSPRVILNESSHLSSKSSKFQQKSKILVVLLSKNNTTEFQEFCLQIYNQSIYLAHKNVTPVILCDTYDQYQALKKDPQSEVYILSSQKTIQKLNADKQYRQSWIVYDSGSQGSRKRILAMPNVVYCTKQLQSLRNKLETKKFISKQNLINEKYRREYIKNQRKVQNQLVTPIHEYIEESVQSIKNFQKPSEKPPSLTEALKSKSSHKTQSNSNYSTQEKSTQIQNIHQNEQPVQAPFSQSQKISQKTNQKRVQPTQYLLKSNESQILNKQSKEISQIPKSNNYQNVYIGPASNRYIDLTDYQKFYENGVLVYRKKSPDKFYFRPVSESLQTKIGQETSSNHLIQNNDYFLNNKSNFNPQNATYDQKIFYNCPQNEPQGIKKSYKTCDPEFYSKEGNIKGISYQNRPIEKEQFSRNKICEQKSKNGKKRTSEEMKHYLDEISSYQMKEDDYQIHSIKKKCKIPQKHLQNQKNLQKSPLLNSSEPGDEKIIGKLRPKSLSKINSLSNISNRFGNSDIFYQNKQSSSAHSNLDTKVPLNTVDYSQSIVNKNLKTENPRSLSLRGPRRPISISAQKRQKRLDLEKQTQGQKNISAIKGESKISESGQKSKSTVQSYLVYVPRDGSNKKTNKIRLTNQKGPRLQQNTSNQEFSVLYLVDHLMDKSVIQDIQSVVTLNDSIYVWKNLSQLYNQIRQSVEVYDLVFVLKDQLISSDEISQFFEVNSACYFVDINPKVENFMVVKNTVKICEIKQFETVLKAILEIRFPKIIKNDMIRTA